jgi:hypothetical protein
MSLPLTAPKNDTGKSAVESWENILNIAALVFLAVVQLPEVTVLIPPTWATYVAAAVAVVNVILRTFRTQKKITSILP